MGLVGDRSPPELLLDEISWFSSARLHGHLPEGRLCLRVMLPGPARWGSLDGHRKIARGGLTDDQKKELWGSLYLTAEELLAFLRYLAEAARHPFMYPMVCMAAHTGARRSDLIRA